MKIISLLISLLFLSTSVIGETLLHCKMYKKCDGYLENCINDLYQLSPVIIPESSKVQIGSNLIDARFNSTTVYFKYLQYEGTIDKNEYSIHLFNKDEVRYGFCEKGNPAW